MVAALVEPPPSPRAWAGPRPVRGPVRPAPAARERPGRGPRPTARPSAGVLKRRRAVVLASALAVLLGASTAVWALPGRPSGPLAVAVAGQAGAGAHPRVWVVRPGDTLWSIAVASGARGDIRPLVQRLSAEVGGRPLQPGERILVP